MASRPGGLTYLEVGATSGVLPAGYHPVHESATVGSGREDFEVAARTVANWGMHRGAGLTVRTAAPTAVAGQDATFGLGPVTIPVRIVYVVDDPIARASCTEPAQATPNAGRSCLSSSWTRPAKRFVSRSSHSPSLERGGYVSALRSDVEYRRLSRAATSVPSARASPDRGSDPL